MDSEIPTPAEVRRRLELLSYAEVKALCDRLKVPFTTVWKLRTGDTTNPRLETVISIWPELPKAQPKRKPIKPTTKAPEEAAEAGQGA